MGFLSNGLAGDGLGQSLGALQVELQDLLQKQISKHVDLEDGAINGVSIAYDLSVPWSGYGPSKGLRWIESFFYCGFELGGNMASNDKE